MNDPRTQIAEALQAIREGLTQVRESVVLAVMRRNRVQSDVSQLERLVADLDAKIALAQQFEDEERKAALLKDLQVERDSRAGELERARALLAQAEAEAETAKIRLPDEEARLSQQAKDLQAQLGRLAANQIESNQAQSEDIFGRAAAKIEALKHEASARLEVANVNPTAPQPPPKTADEMLDELEARLGAPPPAQAEPNAETESRMTMLEFSAPTAPPASEETPQTQATRPPALTIITTPEGAQKNMAETGRIRVAAIGTGGIFRGAHLPCYPDIAQAQLVAFCDPDPKAIQLARARYESLVLPKIEQAKERKDTETADRLQRDFDALKDYEDISQIIAEVKPDLVDICTQPLLHAPLSIQALEAGINVMCEKPIARSWLETERLIPAVERSGKLYQHNENWLWDPDYYTAKKLVDAGAIGEPILMFLATAHGGPEGNPKFWNPTFGGGGSLLDNGIHAIGASWFISGLEKKPTLVKAAEPFGMTIRMPNRIIDGRFQKVTVDDDAHILIRFEDPTNNAWTTAHVEGSWSHRDSPDTAIIGTTGKIVFENDEEKRRYAVVYDAYEREQRRIQVSGSNWQHWPSSFYGEILNMVNCVQLGVQTITPATFGAECSAIVGASYLSQSRGKAGVSPDEFKAFARGIAAKHPNDPQAADDELVDTLLNAVRG